MHDLGRGWQCRRIQAANHQPAAINQDFNIAGSEERTVAELAAIVWAACGNDPAELELETMPELPVHGPRSWPSKPTTTTARA